jgi:hypothetical protein
MTSISLSGIQKAAQLRTHFQALRIFFFEAALQYIIPGP